MRLAVAAAVMVVGCSSEPRDCSVVALSDDYVGSATLDDCGELMDDGLNGIDMTTWQNAQACALDHAMRMAAFRVRWSVQNIEGPPEWSAYIGVQHDGAWALASFHQPSKITGMAGPTSRYVCSSLQAVTAPCSLLKTSLCIECVDKTVADQCAP